MKVYQIRMKVYLQKDIHVDDAQTAITRMIDRSFLQVESLSKLHEENVYKNYCYDLLCPLEKDKIYKAGNIYTLTIRTVDKKMADFFTYICPNTYTREIKGLTAEMRILPRKPIEFIYTLTPVIIKAEQGYWKSCMEQSDYEDRIKINLYKKWRQIYGENIADNKFYTSFEFLNRNPVPMKYKTIKLLGDKLRLSIADDEISQELAYFSLGVGLGEMNSRGAGFVNYRWI